MTFAAITGWGRAVPDRRVTNEELAQDIPGIDAEWIVRRSGIRERRMAGQGESTSTFATAAGRQALERAGVEPEELDVIVVATCTPDRPIPATAPIVQAALGAARAGAFDVSAACAGFVTALGVADGLVRSGRVQRALVVGAETMSRVVDWSDPKTCVLFGDGAGAVVLEASDETAGLLSLTVGAAGEAASLIHVAAGGSAQPTTAETVAARAHVVAMNGPEVYRAAVRIMADAARDAMAAAKLDSRDVDLLILHQANQRIIDEVGVRLGLEQRQVFSNVASLGNTSAASVPIALCEAAEEGRLFPGARVVLSAVGAGLAWAAATVAWTGTRAGSAEREHRTAGALA